MNRRRAWVTEVRRWLLGVLAVVTLIGCSTEKPCAASDVQRVLDVCHLETAGSPTYLYCRGAGLHPPSDFDFSRDAVEACTSRGAADFTACLAARADECLDEAGQLNWDRTQAVAAACTHSGASLSVGLPPAPTVCSQCAVERDACLSQCPTDAWEACASCVAPCELAYAVCFENATDPCVWRPR